MMSYDSRKRPKQGTNVPIPFSYLSSQKKRKKPDVSQRNPRILENNLQDEESRLPSQANIVRHNISYNLVFGSNCLSFIILKIFAFLLFCPLFLPISPDPLDRFCSLQRQYCRQISYNVGQHNFFCICHISRDFLKKPLRHLNLTTFLPISPDPMSRFCSSSNLVSQIKIEVF